MNVKSILSGAFPFLATALSAGGPLGAMAANAIGVGLGINNAKVETIEPAVAAALSANPDAVAKLKEIENNFQIQMTQLGFDQVDKLEAMAATDRASARAREIAVRDDTPKTLAYIVIIATIVLEGFMLFHSLPNGIDPVILGRILGTLDSAATLVLSYYFGSSASSHIKDDTINAAMKQ